MTPAGWGDIFRQFAAGPDFSLEHPSYHIRFPLGRKTKVL